MSRTDPTSGMQHFASQHKLNMLFRNEPYMHEMQALVSTNHMPMPAIQNTMPLMSSQRSMPIGRQPSRVEDLKGGCYDSSTTMSNGCDPSNNSNRRRVPVACGRCRKRKIRCTGDPLDGSGCSACKTAGVAPGTCIFLRVQCSSIQFSPLVSHRQQQASTGCGFETVNMVHPMMQTMQPATNYPAHLQHGLDTGALTLLSTVGDLQSSAALSRPPSSTNSARISTRPSITTNEMNSLRSRQMIQQAAADYDGLSILANGALQNAALQPTHKALPSNDPFVTSTGRLSVSNGPSHENCILNTPSIPYSTYGDETGYPTQSFAMPNVSQESFLPSTLAYYPPLAYTPSDVSPMTMVRGFVSTPNGLFDPASSFGANFSTSSATSACFAAYAPNSFPTSNTRYPMGGPVEAEHCGMFSGMASLSSSLPNMSGPFRNVPRSSFESTQLSRPNSSGVLAGYPMVYPSKPITYPAKPISFTYSRQSSSTSPLMEAYHLSSSPTQKAQQERNPSRSSTTCSHSAHSIGMELDSSTRSNKGSVSSDTSNTASTSRNEQITKGKAGKKVYAASSAVVAIAKTNTTTKSTKTPEIASETLPRKPASRPTSSSSPSSSNKDSVSLPRLAERKQLQRDTPTAIVANRKVALIEQNSSKCNTSSNIRNTLGSYGKL